MKEHSKNKDFLPYRLIDKKKKELNKEIKIWSVGLILLAIALLPLIINSSDSKSNKGQQKELPVQLEKVYSKDSIIKWLEFNNEVTEGNIKNDEGILSIYGNEKLEDLTINENIIIKSVEYVDEEKFKVVLMRRK